VTDPSHNEYQRYKWTINHTSVKFFYSNDYLNRKSTIYKMPPSSVQVAPLPEPIETL